MIEASSLYHNSTSYDRYKMTPHFLDWQNQPMVFKDYPGIKPVSLPRNDKLPEESFISLLRERGMDDKAENINLEYLSLILLLTSTLTSKASHSGGEFHFRSSASAGALYPTEVYVSTNSIDGLEDGLYHFAVHRRCLYPVRLQELSHYIARVIQPTGEKAPILTFFLTVIFFRSAWKYRDRSYRYHLLDTGHLAENLVLALKSLRLPFCLSYNFDDRRVNHLLGLDETKEVALSVAQVPGNKTVSAEGDQEEIGLLPEKMRRSSHVSGHEIDYPSIGEIHRSGALVISYTGPKLEMCKELGLKPETWTNITRPTVLSGDMKYPDALFKRRSRRNFIKEPLLKECMAVLLDSLCIKDYAHSTGETEYFTSVCTGFFADHVEGMAPGLYLLDSSGRSTGLVVEGHFLDRMARICLDQAWLVNAAAHFLFLTNLDLLDSLFGARGYRYAMMSAGRMGERLYLTATAMGLGCCGIGAFYDREAAELIGLNNGSRLLYLVALGPVKGPLIS